MEGNKWKNVLIMEAVEVVDMKKVSVIMPCFNDGAYIEEAVASIRAQTYPNIELVIIDDGSDEPETKAVLEKLESSGAVLLHTNRLRPAGARNAGIAAATGEYILPVDADDLIAPNYIEKAVKIMDDNDNIGVVYCHADLFGEQSGPWELPDYSLEKMLLDNIIFVSAMFRREDWCKVGGYRTTMKHGMEDYDFWLSILELDRSVHQLPEVLFHYRIKPVSRTTRFQEDPAVVQQTYRMIYNQHPVLYEKYKDLYAMVLRDALIEQLFLNRAYQKSIGILEQLKKVPVLKNIIKQIILKK